ncbi:LysM peptidoglycan-binding domain-containing protein [Phenylobacterium immobile]|uniref:CIS tube protein n=1 Tax=Phenylobacterium immobile TaxID=21 RepID=UPI000B26FD8C|nr:LysM peptidoglycan-binding domain-containing protein [Phenylobacterium immobile]
MTALERAELIELNSDLTDVKPGGKRLKVQFNPEQLKVSFSTQTSTPSRTASESGGAPRTGDQAAGTAGRQYLGAGSTKLSLSLWFDVTAATDVAFQVDDVRRLTQEVVYFLVAQPAQADPNTYAPPGVRFQWGAFKFDGIIDSLEENLEFFSSEGRPLRAQISLGLSQQRILIQTFGPPGAAKGPGVSPLSAAPQGATLQGLAQAAGRGDWQAIASANGIENPRIIAPGAMLNLNARASFGGR